MDHIPATAWISKHYFIIKEQHATFACLQLHLDISCYHTPTQNSACHDSENPNIKTCICKWLHGAVVVSIVGFPVLGVSSLHVPLVYAWVSKSLLTEMFVIWAICLYGLFVIDENCVTV